MKLTEKLLESIRENFKTSDSASRFALIGLSPEINKSILQYLESHPNAVIKDKEGNIIPVIFVTSESEEIIQVDDEQWTIADTELVFPTKKDALQKYQELYQNNYETKGWGKGSQNFAVSVRNKSGVSAFYLATTREDLNASINTATVQFGFLPTIVDSDGCGYFLEDDFYLSLFPQIPFENGNQLKDYTSSLRPIFEEMTSPKMAWDLLKALNDGADNSGKITCEKFEAILGLPYSTNALVKDLMLTRQKRLISSLIGKLLSTEREIFFDRLRSELPEREGLIDLFEAYILHAIANTSIDDCKYAVYAGCARTSINGSVDLEPWWKILTVELLERIEDEQSSSEQSLTFEVEAKNAIAGKFKNKKMPLIGRNSMEFVFSSPNKDVTVTVKKRMTELTTDLSIKESFIYNAESKDKKQIKLSFVGRITDREVSRARDVLFLDNIDAGCFVTTDEMEVLKKASPFAFATKKTKTKFKAELELTQETNILLQIYTGAKFELDVSSIRLESNDGTSVPLKAEAYENYFGVRCNVCDEMELSFQGKVKGETRKYVVYFKVTNNTENSYTTAYKRLRECHLKQRKEEANAQINFAAGTNSSILSQDHIRALLGQKDVVGYPVLIADDFDVVKGNCWIDSYKKATAKIFQTVDPRPEKDIWKEAVKSQEAQAYFNARYVFFKLLKEQEIVLGDVVETYSLKKLDLPANESVKSAFVEYLTCYNAWLEADYNNAVVVDTVWAYLQPSNSLGSIPDFVLLLPQHPIRLFWQYQAQRGMHQLLEEGRFSSIVASFDSHSVPDALLLPFRNSTTGKIVRKSYFSVPTSSDYWAAYHSYETSINSTLLETSPFFNNWGFEITSVKRTMSEGEVESAIRATHSVCIAKDSLNIRYVSKNLGGRSARRLLQQCGNFLVGEKQEGGKFGPRIISIIGSQASNTSEGVTDAEIMKARIETGGHLFWYSDVSNSKQNNLKIDVTIASLNASAISTYHMDDSPTRGVICAGGLLRYRNRSRGVESPLEIVESRLSKVSVESVLSDEENVFLHSLSLLEGEKHLSEGVSGHIRFYSDIVDAGILNPKENTSHYYAISSSDIDQACFNSLDGNEGGLGIYLWEYRLPMSGTHSSGKDGFYLLAKESETMIQAISEAVRALNPCDITSDAIRKMLLLSAKRGIPTIKNLASGGRNAFGEVGVLVALDLLQGNLIENIDAGLLPAKIREENFEYFNLLIPMDIFKDRFDTLVQENLGNKKTPTRPDIVVFSIKCSRIENKLTPLRMKLSFVEVKTRRETMTKLAMEDALKQAEPFKTLYQQTPTDFKLLEWAKLDFLVSMLTFGFRIYESVPNLLDDLVDLYPKVVDQLFAQGDFLQVEPLSRLIVIHDIEESKLSMYQNGVAQIIEITKKDGYNIVTSGDIPKALTEVGTWGLQPVTGNDPSLPIGVTTLTTTNGTLQQVGANIKDEREPNSEITSPTSSIKTDSVVLPISEYKYDIESKYEDLLASIKEANESFGIETIRLDTPIETPNAILIDYKGTQTCTYKKVMQCKEEFYTTYGIDLIRVEKGRGLLRFVIRRDAREILHMKDVWEKYKYTPEIAATKGLLIAVKEEDGEPLYLNPSKETSPHTLVAGTTGSGKSVLLVNMLHCLDKCFSKNKVQVYIMDPKKVDFIEFEQISNFTVLSEKQEAIEVFHSLCAEMENRFLLFKQHRVSKLSMYNSLPNVSPLPEIWCFHDEFPDWFGDEEYKDNVGKAIDHLSAKARAAGIYLVFAAQRPDASVMPPFMRNNFGIRLILKVSDEGTNKICLSNKYADYHAHDLLGKGHMIASLSEWTGFCQVPFVESNI